MELRQTADMAKHLLIHALHGASGHDVNYGLLRLQPDHAQADGALHNIRKLRIHADNPTLGKVEIVQSPSLLALVITCRAASAAAQVMEMSGSEKRYSLATTV